MNTIIINLDKYLNKTNRQGKAKGSIPVGGHSPMRSQDLSKKYGGSPAERGACLENK